MPEVHSPSILPYATWDFHISLGADWNDELPQFRDENGDPLDLTGLTALRMWIRPDPDSPTTLMLLTTALGNFTVDDAAYGLISMFVSMNDIQAAFSPAGSVMLEKPRMAWWYLRAQFGTDLEELARGRIYVHPANVATT